MGSVIYAVGKHPVYEEMQASVGDKAFVHAYQDDTYIISEEVGTARKGILTWLDGTRKLGGSPNRSKCKIFVTHDSLMDDAD